MNLSPTTIIFIVIVGVLIFGPDKLPELARKAARVLHFLRGIANQAEQTVRTEFGPEFADFDIRNPRRFVTDKIMGQYGEIADELRDVRGTVQGTVGQARELTSGATAAVTAPIETTVVESQGEPGQAVVERAELVPAEDSEIAPAAATTPERLTTPARSVSPASSAGEPAGATAVDRPQPGASRDWRDAHVARYQAQAAVAAGAIPFDVDAT